MKNCEYCGNAIPPSDGAGRPTSFCSSACRRAAQAERQRITRHLEHLEAEAMDLRHAVERGRNVAVSTPGGIFTPSERLADVQQDIAELRGRLRDSLNEEASA